MSLYPQLQNKSGCTVFLLLRNRRKLCRQICSYKKCQSGNINDTCMITTFLSLKDLNEIKIAPIPTELF